MIDKIAIQKYRKLNELEINFNSTVNIIAGTNGTCKSSILYMISNAFQAMNSKNNRLRDTKAISTINSINDGLNLKIEKLTKGDSIYNDPAQGHRGTLYTCYYENGDELPFRKHNTKLANRYSVKPKYPKGTKQSLPPLPVLYLGLSRLYAFGEYQNSDFEKIKKKLPPEYMEIIKNEYKKFTHVEIQNEEIETMGSIKKRAKFTTDKDGIDSNTISAGEDNLLIILTALVSLRYHHDNVEIDKERKTESIYLIDEIDATLHPAYQIKLLGRV